MPDRLNKLQAWLQGVFPNDPCELTPLLGDAGLRRYFRLQRPDTSTLIVVDIPPGPECGKRFVEIQTVLQATGLQVPTIIANHDNAFLVLADFGDNLLFNSLNTENALKYYQIAIDALIQMQTIVGLPESMRPLDLFDGNCLRQECLFFQEWFLEKYLKLHFSKTELAHIHTFFDALIHRATGQIQCFIHRDYHSKNLFYLPTQEIGIIDFQDAMYGPITYDLVSLIKDCYIDWPTERVNTLARYYFERTPLLHNNAFKDFFEAFEWMGAQRHIKAIFIFARKYLRDGNPHYLHFIPRTINYLRHFCQQYSDAVDFGSLLETHIVPRYQEVIRTHKPSEVSKI